jgi:hypothetical protein
MAEVSDELWELASSALHLAVDCFAAGESNPIVLFVDGYGQRHLVDVKCAQGTVTPQLVERARDIVSKCVGATAQRYAVAFGGYLTSDGKRLDAAFVEAGERGQPEAVLFAQRYRVKKRSGKAERVERPELVQAAEQLLS